MRQIVIQHHAFSRSDLMDRSTKPGDEVESSLDRFREQSFFAEECLDTLVAVRDDPETREIFKRAGHQHLWLQEIIHQREILEQMSDVLLGWETVRGESDAAHCACL